MQISIVVLAEQFYAESNADESEQSKPPKQPANPRKFGSHRWPLLEECESDKDQLTCDFVFP